jgi:xylulokinase
VGRSPLLLGIDVGSGRCKAAVCEPQGRVLGVARRAMPLRRAAGDGAADEPGGAAAAWYPPADLLATVEATVRDAIEVAGDRGDRVAAIGVASMAESGVVLDRDGAPQGEIVAWFDPRGAEEARAIESHVGADALFATTGLRAQAKQTLPRLVRVRRERADVVSSASARSTRGVRWAGVAEYVVHAFTGRLVTVPSLAGRTLAYDLRNGTWHRDLLALAGWQVAQMPEIVEAGVAAGTLSVVPASALGVRAGIPVSVAGHDHVVGAYAAGVVDPGLAADSMGSAEVALLPTSAPLLTPTARSAGLSVGRHVARDRYYLLGALPASGALVGWLADRFGTPAGQPDSLEAGLNRLLAGVQPPSGLVVAPFLAGRSAPSPDSGAGLSLLGLRELHGPADIALAALEGAAMAMHEVVDTLEAVGGERIGEVRLFGGGTRVRHWPELKAAMEYRLVSRVEQSDATALGAAWIGGVPAGLTDPSGPPVTCLPVPSRPELREAYAARWRERYRRLAGGSPQERGVP